MSVLQQCIDICNVRIQLTLQVSSAGGQNVLHKQPHQQQEYQRTNDAADNEMYRLALREVAFAIPARLNADHCCRNTLRNVPEAGAPGRALLLCIMRIAGVARDGFVSH